MLQKKVSLLYFDIVLCQCDHLNEHKTDEFVFSL